MDDMARNINHILAESVPERTLWSAPGCDINCLSDSQPVLKIAIID